MPIKATSGRIWCLAIHSNSVDQLLPMLVSQTVYGENDRVISAHVVDGYDGNLEAPLRVIDQTGGRDTIVAFAYDNWGNVIKQTNSKTGVEADYTYANTTAPAITNSLANPSPYGSQILPGDLHNVKTGELILNQNGASIIPQQTWYNYDPSSGYLLEKAVRSEAQLAPHRLCL